MTSLRRYILCSLIIDRFETICDVIHEFIPSIDPLSAQRSEVCPRGGQEHVRHRMFHAAQHRYHCYTLFPRAAYDTELQARTRCTDELRT